MQQTIESRGYSVLDYVFGSISGDYESLYSISSNRPYGKAILAFLLAFFASILALIFMLYLQFKSVLLANLARLGIIPEIANLLPKDFMSFLKIQILPMLMFLGIAILAWLAFAALSFLMAKFARGQGKFRDAILFNMFLMLILPAFILLGAFVFSNSAAATLISSIMVLLLLIICLRAEYKGIKALHSLTSGKSVLALISSVAIFAGALLLCLI